ncbi:GapR family DNA-binding domain-containing protein [Paradevosia shaoguanensis]|uniref:GapR family DNA-binding domain-containing protein n=1 Tax=Paradevosia shaoguanensis TaxID=1335043 RepID=UPI0019338C59
MTDSVAEDMLLSYFERWERLEGEKDAISADLRELFAEMKGNGFDTKVARKVFRDRLDDNSTERAEFEAVYDLYWTALSWPRAGRARESAESTTHNTSVPEGFDPETGEEVTASPSERLIAAARDMRASIGNEIIEPQPETAEQSRADTIDLQSISVDAPGCASFAGTEGDEGQHPIQPETAAMPNSSEPALEQALSGTQTELINPNSGHRDQTFEASVGQPHSIPASTEPPSTLAGEGSGANPHAAPLNRTSDELSRIASDAVGYGESDRRADASDHSNAGGENVAAPDNAETAEAVSDDAANTLNTQAEAGAVDNGAPSHRVMSITPLEPRETCGLKGFGFSVMFEEKPRSSSGLERMPGCKNLDACAGSRTKRCFTCERDWNAKAHEVDA